MLNFQVACAQKFQNRNDSFLRWSANMECCYLSVKILEKMTRSKYRRANPKNPVFSTLRRIKMHNCFRFVFVFNCVFNLCTCSLLHEISSLTSIMHF